MLRAQFDFFGFLIEPAHQNWFARLLRSYCPGEGSVLLLEVFALFRNQRRARHLPDNLPFTSWPEAVEHQVTPKCLTRQCLSGV